MTSTPLNADEGLLTKMRRLGEKYYGNELYGEHLQYQHELQKLILADRKKHELQAQLNYIEYLDQIPSNELMDWKGLLADNKKLIEQDLESDE